MDLQIATNKASSPVPSIAATTEWRARRTAEVCGKCGCELSPEGHLWQDAVWRGLKWQEVPGSGGAPKGANAKAYRQRIAPVCEQCHRGGNWVNRSCPMCNRSFSVRPDNPISRFCCRRW